jgi:hypothetical protein
MMAAITKSTQDVIQLAQKCFGAFDPLVPFLLLRM